jgi:hypothetical protein
MEQRSRALWRPFLYLFLVLLIFGSAALMLSPAWFRESLMKLQFPVAIQASGLHFVAQTRPEKELDRLKSIWPSNFDANLYDEPDDEIDDAVSNGQMLVVVDFPDRGAWPSSTLHELKKHLKVVPFVNGDWFVTSMGRKLVFVPEDENERIWNPGADYKVMLKEKVRVKAQVTGQKRWFSFEPFELSFAVPSCEVKITHKIETSETAPVRYQAVFHFSSPFPLSLSKIRDRITLKSAEKNTHAVASEIEAGEDRREIEVRSEFLDANELGELVASLPGGDYMQAFTCQTTLQTERVPASASATKLSIVRASIELDQPESSFWPETLLSLTFSQPVAQADVIEHLRVMGTKPWSLKPHPISIESSREHLFTIETDHYEASSVELHLTPGPWVQSGLESMGALTYDKKLSMTVPESLCPRSAATIFELKSGKQNLLACGSPETNPYLVTDLGIWKFAPKKDSLAVRLVGEAAENDDGVSSSVVCYNNDKSRIYISTLRADEKFAENETPPFRGRGERAGYICDPAKFDCLPESFDLEQVCSAPISN